MRTETVGQVADAKSAWFVKQTLARLALASV